MTRASLRQWLFGLTKGDRSRLALTEAQAIAAALAEIDPAHPTPEDYPDACAAPFVHRGAITWCVYPTVPAKCANTFAYVDDETGKVLHVRGWGRGGNFAAEPAAAGAQASDSEEPVKDG